MKKEINPQQVQAKPAIRFAIMTLLGPIAYALTFIILFLIELWLLNFTHLLVDPTDHQSGILGIVTFVICIVLWSIFVVNYGRKKNFTLLWEIGVIISGSFFGILLIIILFIFLFFYGLSNAGWANIS